MSKRTRLLTLALFLIALLSIVFNTAQSFYSLQDKTDKNIFLIGNVWSGMCGKTSWMIIPTASNTGKGEYIKILEGDPNVGLTAVQHPAPGIFKSGCVIVEVKLQQGYYTFKVVN